MATTGGDIRVQLIGDDALKRKLVGSRADKPVSRFLDRGAFYMQGQARKHAPVDQGTLRNSIGTDSPNNRLRSIGPSVDYGAHVEFGTSAHWPPPGSLNGWAKRHGMLRYDKDGNPSDYHIRRSIGMHGTEKQPYMQPAADETETFVITIIPVLAAELESAFS